LSRVIGFIKMSIRFTHEHAYFFSATLRLNIGNICRLLTSNSHQEGASQIIYMRHRAGRVQKVLHHATFAATALKPSRISVAGKQCPDVKMTVFWDTAHCSLVELDRRFRCSYCLQHQDDDHSDDGGSMHIWNVGVLWNYKALYSRKLSSLYSPQWKPEISQCTDLIPGDENSFSGL
jgi:hypothetical protein